MQVSKQQLELDMEQQTGSKSGKEFIKSVDCHPAYLIYMQSTMVFPVVICGCESWTIKKAEHGRIDAFELWWRIPWTARRSNKFILKKSVLNIPWKGWCRSWNSNTLATWGEELTHWKRPWCWERLKVGGEGDDSGWAGWMASPTQWTLVWVKSGSWWWTGRPGVHEVAKSWTRLSDWTDWLTEPQPRRQHLR